ncbi:putative ATPase [Bacillus phage PBC4]|uniref:Putative ATPase n=1 Tax=Bacillus phage PBC4 TaxID=1675028 RepID=A0A1D6X8A0_9CAUD|nr:putative ATPase [Bacillus phage PBC4]AKQ08246.1 putative ATPase [Bacillus phage PBC4]
MNPMNPMEQLGIHKAGTKELFLRVLLSGHDGAGKSTVALFGAETPTLVIDPERKSEIYSHVADFDIFDNDDPEAVLNLTKNLLAMQNQTGQSYYKTIIIDSGTVLWQRIKKHSLETIKEKSGNPDKFKLEFNEGDMPKDIFYESINNLKRLNCHLIITAHTKDNYLKGTMMKIDPNTPLVPDVEKRLPYEIDVHLMLKKTGQVYKCERVRSNVVDKDKNQLIPAVIDKFDNSTLLKVILEHARRDKGFVEAKPEQQNIIKTDAALSNQIDEIVSIITQQLQMSNETAIQFLSHLTNGQVTNPYSLTAEQAPHVLNQVRNYRDNMLQQQPNQEG